MEILVEILSLYCHGSIDSLAVLRIFISEPWPFYLLSY